MQVETKNRLNFSTEVIREISERILLLSEKNVKKGFNTIVCIAGGSCTGKTSHVGKKLNEILQPYCQLLSQDHYQKGLIDNIDPIYRWDAPDNYGIKESVTLLNTLKHSMTAHMPVYSFKEKKHIDIQKIQPSRIILFEGLYAAYDGLEDIANLIIYTEAPFYARFLRRVFRNSYDRYQSDPETVIKHLLSGGVYKAHRDLVRSQAEKATICIRTPYTIQETIAQFNLQVIDHTPTRGIDELYSFPLPENAFLKVEQYADNNNSLYLSLYVAKQCYLHVPIDEDTYHLLINSDMLEY